MEQNVVTQQNALEIMNKIEKLPQTIKVPTKQSIQQKKQAYTVHSTKELNNFYCDIYLHSGESLKIILTSQLDASIYELILSKQLKKQHEELNFFETIDEIYEYLIENIQQPTKKDKQQLIHIEQNGRISIIVVSTIGKKQRQRTIYLQPIKVTQNKDVYLQNVVKKIGKNVLQLKKQIEILKERQAQSQKITNELLLRLKQYGTKFTFFSDKSDSHYGKFRQVDKRITKLVDNTTYFTIYSETPIPKNQNCFFNIKIGTTLNKDIMIGIGSKFIKGIPNVYSHQDFIGFYPFKQGFIWQKGNQRDLKLNYPVEQGCTITTNINSTLGFINWEICGVRVAYTVIPTQLKAKLLYAAVLMINVNDCIQIDV